MNPEQKQHYQERLERLVTGGNVSQMIATLDEIELRTDDRFIQVMAACASKTLVRIEWEATEAL